MLFGVSLLAVALVTSSCGRGQTSNPPPTNSSSKLLSVEVFVFSPDHVYYAPTNIHIQAFVTMAGAQAGDSVRVDFFANTKKLGSTKATWHDAIFPPNDPHHFHYMHVLPAGFDPMEVVWKKAEPGDYTLTARASSPKALAAASKPVEIKILPSR
jgi:hypothetical protein